MIPEFSLKPCPWCNVTPVFWLPPNYFEEKEKGWLWFIGCENPDCSLRPKTPMRMVFSPLGKNNETMEQQMRTFLDCWNTGNPMEFSGKTEVRVKQILEN